MDNNRSCKICNKQFYEKPYRIKKGYGLYCSRKCFGIGSRVKRPQFSGKNNPSWKGGQLEKSCITCNKLFKIYPSRLKYGRSEFCSRGCYYKWQTNQPKKRIVKHCEYCNNELRVKPSQIDTRFCSVKCYGNWMSKNIVGEKHPGFGRKTSDELKKHFSNIRKGRGIGVENPNWRGGLSFFPYSSLFNELLKRKIRERDNYTCQLCNKTKSKDVHHIDYDKNNCSEYNLITLCKKCNCKVNGKRMYWKLYFTKKVEKYATF